MPDRMTHLDGYRLERLHEHRDGIVWARDLRGVVTSLTLAYRGRSRSSRAIADSPASWLNLRQY